MDKAQLILKVLASKLSFSPTKRGGNIFTQDLFDLSIEELKQMRDVQLELLKTSHVSADAIASELGLQSVTPSKSSSTTNSTAKKRAQIIDMVLTFKENKAANAKNATALRERATLLKEAALEKDKRAIMEADGNTIESALASIANTLAELEED